MRLCTGWLGASAMLLALDCAGQSSHQGILPLNTQGILDSQAEMDLAATERDWALKGLAANRQDVQISWTLRERAQRGLNQQQAQLAQAEEYNDYGTMPAARERVRVAALAVSGADARVAWLRQQQRVGTAEVALAEAHQRAANARLELERARLASRQNRHPGPPFQLDPFEQRVAERERQRQAAQDYVEEQRIQAARLREQYAQLVQQYNQERTQVSGTAPFITLPPPAQTERAHATGPSLM